MTDKKPVFGPNGAVMNGPGMSDDLREDYEEEQRKGAAYAGGHLIAVILMLGIFLIPIPYHLIPQPVLTGLQIVSFASTTVYAARALLEWMRRRETQP